ncbi:DUF4221 family protein [Algoriphagus aquimarinus]|uniref:DUF4221 domain-containing protein n=1 Tax=Algoriphagus aquimarinus TaxID=237018 RepID=A0A1I1CF40_9BACT|nr:DUF4221 family protein [Algoriphagus aquimarinus]SFB60682.1 protein of unknown function [Algoriphagus aquimarinus]
MNKIKLLTPIILAVLASCGTKDGAENTQGTAIELSYELDTVMVDAGDKFIYLNSSLINSGLSQDGKYLYNFKTGVNPTGIEVIDLDNLKLERVIPMTVDGPNAIRSPYMSNIYMLADGTFYLSDNYEVYHFDQEGNKLSTMVYAKQEFEGERLPEGKRIQLNETLSKDEKTIATLYGGEKMEDSADGLALFDLENKRVKYKELGLFKELDKYQTIFYYEKVHPMNMLMADISLLMKNDSLLFSNSAQNKIYFYNLATDSISSKTYSSKFTSQEAKGNYPPRSDSEEEFQAIFNEKSKEVSYGSLFFDEHNDVYWRFAKEMDYMKGDTIQYKTVLTAFDPEFNQVHEELLPSDFVLPYKYFARKGMIYTFLNIEDELAFVRLKPTISYE